MDHIIDEASSLYAKYGADDLDMVAGKLGLTVYDLLDAEHLNEVYFPRLGAIVVKPGLPSYLRRFLVGHSLGHHLLHRQQAADYLRFHLRRPATGSDPAWHKMHQLETEADLFAAFLLVPEHRLQPVVKLPWFKQSTDPVLELAIEFQVPPEVMRVRLVYEGCRSLRNQG
jgi:Zn-dependent peptidase ImmA (M78 family)